MALRRAWAVWKSPGRKAVLVADFEIAVKGGVRLWVHGGNQRKQQRKKCCFSIVSQNPSEKSQVVMVSEMSCCSSSCQLVQPPSLQLMRLLMLVDGFMSADWDVTLGFSSSQPCMVGIGNANAGNIAVQLRVYVWLKSSYKLPTSGVTNVCSHIP